MKNTIKFGEQSGEHFVKLFAREKKRTIITTGFIPLLPAVNWRERFNKGNICVRIKKIVITPLKGIF